MCPEAFVVSLQPLFLSLVDPRGRCNRKGLLMAAAIMLGVEVVAGLGMWASERTLDDPLVVAIKVALFYLAVSAAIQRLHDLGRSAWNMLWASLAMLVWSVVLAFAVVVQMPPDQMEPGKLGFAVVFAGIALPMLAMLLWLHFAPGESKSNRYGAIPGALGFARVTHSHAEPMTPHATSAA